MAQLNINKPERMASLLGGSALAVYGLTRRSWGGLALAGLGGFLLQRGATGHCHAYAAVGVSRADKQGSIAEAVPGHGGILVQKSVTINKSAQELYEFWRQYENLPKFMQHLVSVEERDDKTSHWVAKAPTGQVEWDAETVRDNAGELIAWRSLPGAQVENSGSVRFLAAPEGRGTQVKVTLEYNPPAGALGALVAKLLGEEPSIQVEDDLNRFKQLMEAGEIATNASA